MKQTLESTSSPPNLLPEPRLIKGLVASAPSVPTRPDYLRTWGLSALLLLSTGCQLLRHRPDELPLAVQSMQVYALPKALVSNPSSLTFGGWLPDGRAQLYTVLDGSAMVKDHIDPARLVLELRLNPTPTDTRFPPVEVIPLNLDAGAQPCDLESIEVDPRDGSLLVADERVAGLASCGGNGPHGEARTQVFRISRTGALLGGPWPMEVVNTHNNGIEAIAARLEGSQTHLYVLKEWMEQGCPYIVDYAFPDDPTQGPTQKRKFELDCGFTQTAADFHKPTGSLLVVDRDARLLKRFNLDTVHDGATPADSAQRFDSQRFDSQRLDSQRLDSQRFDLNALLELVTGGVYDRRDAKELRRGMVEGLASDDKGGLYLMLDNNGDAFAQGDSNPRMVYLKPLSELKKP